jgi:hypothetical protein
MIGEDEVRPVLNELVKEQKIEHLPAGGPHVARYGKPPFKRRF